MKEFDESDYVKQKVLANNIISSLFVAHGKITKKCVKVADEICELENNFEKEQNIKKLNLWSKQISEKRDELTKILAVKNRIDKIIARNEQRIEFFDKKLKEAGIYNEKYNKSELAEMEKMHISDLSVEAINLNDSFGEDKKKRYFAGVLLIFDGDKIDFEENADVLQVASADVLHKIVFSYPSSVNSITDELLLNTKLKQNLLKEIVAFVTENAKNKSIKEINSMLGGLLSFKTQIPKDVESYVAGVQNLFKVMVKGNLMTKFPDEIQEIALKLPCNERSELIPASRKVAVLANGMASNAINNEEWESEEIRKSQEKDSQIQTAINENLSQMYDEQNAENEDEQMRENAQDEVKKQEEYKKQKEEEKKLEEEEQLNKELEEMLFSMYKDDSTEG